MSTPRSRAEYWREFKGPICDHTGRQVRQVDYNFKWDGKISAAFTWTTPYLWSIPDSKTLRRTVNNIWRTFRLSRQTRNNSPMALAKVEKVGQCLIWTIIFGGSRWESQNA